MFERASDEEETHTLANQPCGDGMGARCQGGTMNALRQRTTLVSRGMEDREAV